MPRRRRADGATVSTRVLPRVLALAAVLAALLPAQASPSSHGSAASLASLESAVLVRLNEIRAAHGLAPLRLSRDLSAAAGAHSGEMLANGYFSHDSADGSSFSGRVRRYYAPPRAGSWSVGENLLWATGTIDAGRALDLWMASPGHRANILSPRWREIGIAALAEAGAPGTFGGATVTLVTTDFGARG
jgi:uncharacterized protein YkwD